MRAILLCIAVAGALATAGCVNKGPYYIYGDYIEHYGGADYDLEEEDEYPPEETAPEEGAYGEGGAAERESSAAAGKKII